VGRAVARLARLEEFLSCLVVALYLCPMGTLAGWIFFCAVHLYYYASVLLERERFDAFVYDRSSKKTNRRGRASHTIYSFAQDQLDAIDLSDNSIHSLSNLPHLSRLRHFLLSNNPINTISPNLPSALPNLVSLILTGSQVSFIFSAVPRIFGLMWELLAQGIERP
jgi:Leucine-rich repeat (LRR) protein